MRKGASLRTPLQSTPAVSPVEPPVTHYQVPTVATATVVSAHGSENTDYAYTDITNHPPQPDDISGPMYSELLHQPPRTHGNSDLSYADPADMVFDGDQQAVYDPVCPTSPSYDVPALEEYSSVSVSQYLSLLAHSSPVCHICPSNGCTLLYKYSTKIASNNMFR